MRFNHIFRLTNENETHREYKCDNVNINIDFISGSALRVAVFNDNAEMLPTFTVNPNNNLSSLGRSRLSVDGFDCVAPVVEKFENKEKFVLDCGVTVDLDLNNFILTYSKESKLLFGDRAPLAYNFEGEFGNGSYHYITREDDEHIFGLGDKSGPINKAGQVYRIETADSMGFDAEKTDPLYKHVPFYICENSVGAYGIYYDTTDTSFVDLGREINNYYCHFKYFKTDDDCLVYYVFLGSKLSALQQYARLCGKQAFPPKWSFDYCGSTMAYTDAPDAQNQMQGFLDKIKDLDLSCGGFYLSSGYTSIGNLRCVFNWNYDKFPDPEKFVADYNNAGIHLIPNIKPAFLTSHPMYDELAKKGFFVKNADGTPYVTQFWDGVGSYLDFTNSDAFDFWGSQVTEKLLDFGIDATWNDNNEFDIKATDAVAAGFGEKASACRIRPILTYLMVLSSYKAQMKKHPEKRPFLSTRSGNSGVRRLAQTWSGDNFTSFHDLRFCHYVGMTMSLSGFYFYGHDLGGFSGEMPSEELLLRWMQHGVFEPRFTIHSWNGDGSATMPWSYESGLCGAKAILRQRKSLIPYLYNCAYNSVENDVPVQAPPYIYYDDENIDVNTDAFMLGRDVLAACVLDEGIAQVPVYLPKGDDWYLNETGKLYCGASTVKVDLPSDKPVPYFIRSGSVFPVDEGECSYKSAEKVVFTVYPVKNGKFTARYFNDDGESFEYLKNNCVKLEFDVNCDNENVNVVVNNKGNVKFTPEIKLVSTDLRKLNVSVK